jgi:hypothetical protein
MRFNADGGGTPPLQGEHCLGGMSLTRHAAFKCARGSAILMNAAATV